MRSFSNLWFWIALAALWSTATHWVLGVPYDMVARARRRGGQVEADVEALVRIYSDRLIYISEVLGAWVTAAASAVLSALAVTGFWYDVEFAQALFLLFFPLGIVGVLATRTARRIRAEGARGRALYRRLDRHRFAVRGVGLVAIFVTGMWGMYQNLAVGPLGG